ncbi:MAG: cation diffusion facilitator family transporter [Alphaproteobacteria bacterium]
MDNLAQKKLRGQGGVDILLHMTAHSCNHDHGAHGHEHHHGHGHHGHHHHVPKNFDRRFAIGAAINMIFVVLELVFGFISNSLALIADAVHNFSDVVGLLLAWGGAWLARLMPSARRTYGFRSATILAALANAALLFIVVGAITIEAVHRFFNPAEMASMTVVWVAGIGIVINTATAMMFWHGQKDDINIRGAFLHMAADAAVSLGVVIAALIVMATNWFWIDPVISLVIAAVILWSTWGLAKEALHLSLAGVPPQIDHAAVKAWLAALPGVTEVHDLHIWAMSTTENALTVHLLRPGAALDDGFLHMVAEELQKRFQIHHPTIQIEIGNLQDGCKLAPADVV